MDPEAGIAYAKDSPIAVVNGKLVIPVGRRQVSAMDIVEALKDALSTAYTGKDPAKRGLTKGEAALLSIAENAQDGDAGAFEFLLNRLMGKPVQQVNQMNVSASLKEFLEGLSVETERCTVDPLGPAEIDPLGD